MKRVFDDRRQEVIEMADIANELNGMLQSPVSRVQKAMKKFGLKLTDFTESNGRMYREFWTKTGNLMSEGVMLWFQSNGAFESEDDKLVMVSSMSGEKFQKIKQKSVSRQYDSQRLKGGNMKRIKDEDEGFIDGLLLVAFYDGDEEEGYNEIKKHANERDTIDNQEYETYDVDNSDGVTLVDICAKTDNPNAFVKALLEKWGILKNVADLEFEASDNMKEEVSDSRKVKDDKDSDLKLFYDILLSTTNDNGIYLLGKQNWHDNSLEFTFSLDDSYKKNIAKIKIPSGSYNEMKKNLFVQMGKWLSKLNGENKHGLSPEFVKGMNELYYHLMSELNSVITDSRKVSDMIKPAHLKGYAISQRKKRRENPDKLSRVESDVLDEDMDNNDIYDSQRVSDMTKPIRWKAYAERVRAKRQTKNDEPEEKDTDEKLSRKQGVYDSRRRKVRDMVSPKIFDEPDEDWEDNAFELIEEWVKDYPDADLDDAFGFIDYWENLGDDEYNRQNFDEYMHDLGY